MDPLNKIHKRNIRIMTKCSRLTHTSPLFHKLNILKIKDINNLEMAKTMYKYHNDQCTKHHNINTPAHNHATRYVAKLNYSFPIKRTELETF